MSKPRFKFDQEHSLEQRKSEASRIISKYPDRVPVIVEPAAKCNLQIDKKKYLVPRDLTVGQFIFVIRKRIKIPAEHALFLFVNGTIPSSASMMSSIYDNNMAEDGFLKITYSQESTFG